MEIKNRLKMNWVVLRTNTIYFLTQTENLISFRSPLKITLFPVHRPGGLISAEWVIIFRFRNVSPFFLSIFLVFYYIKIIKRFPGLPTGFYSSHPLDRKQFLLRAALP